jgi:RNA polymerase sigma factor (TIGR02999 family)
MLESGPSEITGLLQRWSAGDERARDQLMPLVYDRLRDLAHRRLQEWPTETSLNTTGLVHEAYIRLLGTRQYDLPDRAHFLGLMSEVMRHLIIGYWRARRAVKRGGGEQPLELNEALSIADTDLDRFAALDEALTRLEAVSPRQAKLLQHRYFGGLSLEESATAADVSLATAKRDLQGMTIKFDFELAAGPSDCNPDAPKGHVHGFILSPAS